LIRRLHVFAALVTVIGAISIGALASASLEGPTIRNFQFHPLRVTYRGGEVTVTATVSGATACRLSSIPLLAGLPATTRCPDGTYRRVVRLPANLANLKTYNLQLRATGHGLSTAATKNLLQLPYIPLLSWTSTIVDPSGRLLSVSCPTTTWCMAADTGGDVITFDGSKWSKPTSVGAKFVSCPSTTFCAAATFGHSLLTFNGSTWSTFSSVGPSDMTYEAISCSTAAHCIALGENGGLQVDNGEAIDNGGTWAYKSLGVSTGIIDTASCPTAQFCVAVSLDGISVAYHGSNVYGGYKWGPGGQVVPPVGATGAEGAVSCTSSQWCMYVGDGASTTSTDVLGYAVPYSQGSWSRPVVVDGAGQALPVGVSCVPTGYCVAVNESGAASTHFRGAWSAWIDIDKSIPYPQLDAVACASTTFCVAVGSNGEALVGR
jgi:hypothetical protein